jgi:hypothetical protein
VRNEFERRARRDCGLRRRENIREEREKKKKVKRNKKIVGEIEIIKKKRSERQGILKRI